METKRLVERIIDEYHSQGDYQGWFEALYAAADGDGDKIPWAKMLPHPYFTRWARRYGLQGDGKRALVVGCGLGDDAIELAERGFKVTAFDLSETAIQWTKKRFENTPVDFQVMDLFKAPDSWNQAYDFVLEINTVQAMPPDMRPRAVKAICGFVAPGGTLLVIARGVDDDRPVTGPPWPMKKADFKLFDGHGLTVQEFEDYRDHRGFHRFRASYRRKAL